MAGDTPKTMSSRLMTMKFMQRSAAKNTASAPSTPNGPPSKRMRLSHGGSAPGTPDHEILQSAVAAEEKKRQEALDKAAQHTGETKWVLSFHDPLDGKRQEVMKVRHAGFAEIDAQSDSEYDSDDQALPIRKQFGGGVKRAEKPTFQADEQSEGESESGSESDEYDSDDPTAALIRETRREVAAEARKSRDAPKQQEGDSPRGLARRPREDVSLQGLSSLSGRGQQASGPRNMSNVECYKCGQKGHLKTNCPQARGSAGRGKGKGYGSR